MHKFYRKLVRKYTYFLTRHTFTLKALINFGQISSLPHQNPRMIETGTCIHVFVRRYNWFWKYYKRVKLHEKVWNIKRRCLRAVLTRFYVFKNTVYKCFRTPVIFITNIIHFKHDIGWIARVIARQRNIPPNIVAR